MSKLGTRPDLERKYKEAFVGSGDSLRARVLEAHADGHASAAEWETIFAKQRELDAIKDELSAAGYSMEELVALTLAVSG
jgi:hypothetical protein